MTKLQYFAKKRILDIKKEKEKDQEELRKKLFSLLEELILMSDDHRLLDDNNNLVVRNIRDVNNVNINGLFKKNIVQNIGYNKYYYDNSRKVGRMIGEIVNLLERIGIDYFMNQEEDRFYFTIK